jgi:hypothetical protein
LTSLLVRLKHFSIDDVHEEITEGLPIVSPPQFRELSEIEEKSLKRREEKDLRELRLFLGYKSFFFPILIIVMFNFILKFLGTRGLRLSDTKTFTCSKTQLTLNR